MKWFAIFKKGQWKDSQGRDFVADDARLARIVEVNQGRDVPIVIGHPKTDSPKWGTANAFKQEGDLLFAHPNHLTPEFLDWVRKKLWNKVSISLNDDLTMNHIGFLGAAPPAVAGLPDVEFAASFELLSKGASEDDIALEKVIGGIATASPKTDTVRPLMIGPEVHVEFMAPQATEQDRSLEEVIRGIASASPKRHR